MVGWLWLVMVINDDMGGFRFVMGVPQLSSRSWMTMTSYWNNRGDFGIPHFKKPGKFPILDVYHICIGAVDQCQHAYLSQDRMMMMMTTVMICVYIHCSRCIHNAQCMIYHATYDIPWYIMIYHATCKCMIIYQQHVIWAQCGPLSLKLVDRPNEYYSYKCLKPIFLEFA